MCDETAKTYTVGEQNKYQGERAMSSQESNRLAYGNSAYDSLVQRREKILQELFQIQKAIEAVRLI